MSKVVAAAKRLMCDRGPPPRAAGSWGWSWYPVSTGHLPELCPERPNLNSREDLPVMGDLVSLPWGPSARGGELLGGRAAVILLLDPFKTGLNNALNGLWATTLRWWKNGCSGPVILLKGLICQRNCSRNSGQPPSCVVRSGKDPAGMGWLRVQKHKKDLLKTAACLRKGLCCCLHCLFAACKPSDEKQTAVAVGLFSPTCVWVSNGGGLLKEHLRRACCLAGVSNA